MSASIIEYPKRVTPENNISSWVALHNPIIYKIQRKDYVISSIVTSSGKIKVTLASPVSSPDSLNVGDLVYIKSGNYDIVSSIRGVNSDSEFIMNVAFNGNSTGGFANLNTIRENYHIELDVLTPDETNIYYVLGSLIITPDKKGLMKVDIHEWLKELGGYSNDYDYETINVKDENLSNTFNIRYIETWSTEEGNDIQESSILPSYRHYFVNAAKYVSDVYGQNMAVYVPHTNEAGDKAKWLSGFESPTIFRGYPFDLQFIYSDNISPYIVSRESEQFDLNGNSISSDSDDLDTAGIERVNRMKIPTLEANAKRIDIYLQITIGDPARLFQSCYATDYADDYDIFVDEPEEPNPPIE